MVRIVSTLTIIFLLFSAAAQASSSASLQHEHVWDTYTNVRFGYSICYPSDVLIPQGESDRGDGQIFVAQDGAEVRAYGYYNASFQTMKDVMNETVQSLAGKSGQVTYKVLKPHFTVVSGRNGAKTFYAKTLYDQKQEILATFQITYSHQASTEYDAIVERMAKCFANHRD